MFNLHSKLSTRVSKWVTGALIAGFFVALPVAIPELAPKAQAGVSPAADLDVIATYLRNYQDTDLWNPNFYKYLLDGNSKNISDGGFDMYDAGNNTAPWLISGASYSQNTNINDANALAYDVTTSSTIDGDFKYVSLGYAQNPSWRLLTMLGTRTVAGNPIGFQKYGNAGSDGGGTLLSERIYTASVINGFTVHAFYRLNYNASDPSICDLYMLIGQPSWDSSFGTITPTGVTITPTVPLTKGSDVCVTGCVPKIISVSTYTGFIGDIIILTGINFNGATQVIFDVFTPATNFTVDSDTQISVQVPSGLPLGEVGIEIVAPGGTSARFFDFEVI